MAFNPSSSNASKFSLNLMTPANNDINETESNSAVTPEELQIRINQILSISFENI